MDQQVDEDCKSLLPESNKQKRVRFADFPIVYKAAPPQISVNYLDQDFLMNQPTPQGILKNSEFSLRTPVDNESKMTFSSLLILILLLCFLFFVIWWTVSKLLLVEIEEQVGDHVMENLKQ